MSAANTVKRAALMMRPYRAIPSPPAPRKDVSSEMMQDTVKGSVKEFPIELRGKLVDILLEDVCVERFPASLQKAIQAALEDTPALPTAKRATRSQLTKAVMEDDLPLSAMQRDRAAIADTLIEDDVRTTSKASHAVVQRAMLEDDLTERTVVRASTNALLDDDFKAARPTGAANLQKAMLEEPTSTLRHAADVLLEDDVATSKASTKRVSTTEALLNDSTARAMSFSDVMAGDDVLLTEKLRAGKAATAAQVSRAMLEDTLTEETACAMQQGHNVAEALVADAHKLSQPLRQAQPLRSTPFYLDDSEFLVAHRLRREEMAKAMAA